MENVDETMDEIREQMDLANEVSNAISQPFGMGLDIDEVIHFFCSLYVFIFHFRRN